MKGKETKNVNNVHVIAFGNFSGNQYLRVI